LAIQLLTRREPTFQPDMAFLTYFLFQSQVDARRRVWNYTQKKKINVGNQEKISLTCVVENPPWEFSCAVQNSLL
jgi:hypothetical protein